MATERVRANCGWEIHHLCQCNIWFTLKELKLLVNNSEWNGGWVRQKKCGRYSSVEALLWLINSKTTLKKFSLPHSPHSLIHPAAVFMAGVQLVRQLLEPSHPTKTSLPRLIGPKVSTKNCYAPAMTSSITRAPNFSTPVSLEQHSTGRIQLWHFTGGEWQTDNTRVRWGTFGINDQLSLCPAQQTWCGQHNE